MTNFEKIKQMSVEDMAEMLLDASEKHSDCVYAIKKWLESEVDTN